MKSKKTNEANQFKPRGPSLTQTVSVFYTDTILVYSFFLTFVSPRSVCIYGWYFYSVGGSITIICFLFTGQNEALRSDLRPIITHPNIFTFAILGRNENSSARVQHFDEGKNLPVEMNLYPFPEGSLILWEPGLLPVEGVGEGVTPFGSIFRWPFLKPGSPDGLSFSS